MDEVKVAELMPKMARRVLKLKPNAAYTQDMMEAARLRQLIAPALAPAPAPAPVPAAAPVIVSRSDIIPEYIKNIKVGDTIQYGQGGGYMGDGGDSRDSAYNIFAKVLKVLGNYTYEVEPQFRNNEPEKFKIDSTGEWLRDTNNGRLSVLSINGIRRPDELSDAAIDRQKALEKKKRADKAAKVAADITKATKSDLIQKIEIFMSKQGKRLTGLKTASKETLLKIISERGIS
jgi:hypothetical protein